MKKILAIFLLATAVLVGCNDDDDYYDHEYHLEYIGAVSAEVPDTFEYGRTYRIEVTIELPNSCYYFYNQYDYFYEGTSRLIYPIAHVDDGVSCSPDARDVTFSIRVQALQLEPYIFHFYQGEDEEGQDIFLTLEVPVI